MVDRGLIEGAAGQAGQPPDRADHLDVVIDPRSTELARLRSAVWAWLATRADTATISDSIVLVASETATLAMRYCDPGHPLVISLRRTHSIVVIEAEFHGDRTASSSALLDLWTDPDGLEGRIITHLADHVIADAGGQRVRARTTFHLPVAGPAPG